MPETKSVRTYLGVPLYKPRVAFFELTSCEGCQLQIVNNEATLLDFLSLVELVNFREAMTGAPQTAISPLSREALQEATRS